MSEFRRRLMMVGSGGALPYDAEVEWLKNNGNSYIDTGIECTGDLKVRFVASAHDSVNRACCGGINTNRPYFRHHFSPTTPFGSLMNFYWIQHDDINTASIQKNFSTNSWYDVTIDPINGSAVIDGDAYQYTALSSSSTTGKSYGIFARIGSDNGLQTKSASFKLFQMWRNDVMLRDFIPVRIGTIGYMYDKVSGQLFGNSGTGAFILGNDVNI